ncbi:TetR/AcrR family transcriptional regulator [Clostridium algidicarnis]|mgnify:CR=1 FL=1|uniref:TetR/AcrR family transcriptional regulator n=1 Tax=Clostridium algidicarnis TaxID=37659 RepID=UPI003FD81BFB
MSRKPRLDMDMILNTTAKLVEEKGIDNVTLNNIAENLGVKSPSLYNHINGLADLSIGLAKLAIEKLDDVVRNAAVGKSKKEALIEMANAYRKFSKDSPELYKAILKLPIYNEYEIKEKGHAVIRIIYQVLEAYNLSEEDTIHFSRGFRSALHGFVSLEEAGFFSAGVDVDESYNRLVHCFVSILNQKEAK